MNRFWRGIPALLLCGALALGTAACSDDTSVFDTGVKDSGKSDTAAKTDGGKKDGIKADKGKVDAAKVDAAKVDAAKVDQKVGTDAKQDSGPAGSEMVAYAHGSSTTTFTLSQVKVDGTGQKAAAGMTKGVDLESINVTHSAYINSYPADLTYTRPQRRDWSSEYWILLPGKLGRLIRYDNTTEYGFAVVRPNGAVQVLAKGKSANLTDSYFVGLSDNGKVAALVLDLTKVLLARLDGTNWPGSSSPVRDVSPTGITKVEDDSLTLLQKNLYFVCQNTSTKTDRSLWSVSLSGPAKSAKVTLPKVGGAAATTIYYQGAMNSTRTHTAWLIGSTTTTEDVMVIKDGGTPLNVSKLATDLYNPYNTGFFDTLYPRMAITPGGAHIAFYTASGGTPKYGLMLAKTDGTGTPAQLNPTTAFVSAVDNYGSLFFQDNDNLLFAAGTTSEKVDLFLYKLSTKALANLTKTGTATKAPWDGGVFELDGGWISPNSKYLYLAIYKSATDSNLIAVDLGTFVKKDITTGMYISFESDIDNDLETVPGSSNVWFVGLKGGKEDIYVFDQNTASAPTNLTKFASSSDTINNMHVSPDGKYVSYMKGTTTTEVLYILPTAGGKPTTLVKAGPYLEDSYTWTTDSSAVVYGAGSSTSSKMDLFLITTAAGTPKKLHAAQGVLHIFSTGK